MDFLLLILALLSLLIPSDCCVATPSTSTPCRNCAANLIVITTNGAGSHPMDGDVIDRTGAQCAVRTFTCLGVNANIEINNGEGVVNDGDDGAVDGRATFTVTCNTAGTAWVNSGIVITQVECASG